MIFLLNSPKEASTPSVSVSMCLYVYVPYICIHRKIVMLKFCGKALGCREHGLPLLKGLVYRVQL